MKVARLQTALALAGLVVLLAAPASAEAAPALPPGFQDTVVFSGLEKPTAFRFAPNGMVFVAEKAGRIEVYEDLEDETPELFANLTVETYDRSDRGLLGLAIDPEFPAKPYVYALFTYNHASAPANRFRNGARSNTRKATSARPRPKTAPTTAWSAVASSVTPRK
jgi:glucose/arabinose dehydrogenase